MRAIGSRTRAWLAASLALNVALVAGGGAYVLKARTPPGTFTSADTAVIETFSMIAPRLTDQDRQILLSSLRPLEPGARPDVRQSARAALLTEPFDAAALQAVLDQAAEVKASERRGFVSAVSRMSPAGRQALAAALVRDPRMGMRIPVPPPQ